LDVVELDWESASDEVLAIGQQESYKHSLKLLQAGLMAGPSTGLNYAGLLRYLEETVKDKPIDQPLNAVFVACDTPLPYVDDYFKILPREDFPELEGEELMAEKIFAE
jgi:cysteine synthase